MFIWPNLFGYRLGTAKISLKSLNSFWSYLEKTKGVKMTPLSPLRVTNKTVFKAQMKCIFYC